MPFLSDDLKSRARRASPLQTGLFQQVISLAVLLLCLVVPAVTQAQDSEPFCDMLDFIAPGDETAGRIDDVRFGYVYCFSGAAGDEIQIDMTRAEGDLDPYLIVMRPTFSVDDLGVVAVGADVHLASRDAQVRLSLPESGMYLLVATRDGLRGGVTSGVFVLRLAVVPGG
jgi:hypothetical protein